MSSNATSIRSGVILNGRYRICREIGEGGFGRIFKAVDISQGGKAVAVKTNLRGTGKKLAGFSQLESVDDDSTQLGRKKKLEVTEVEPVCEFIREYWALKHLENYPGFPKVYAQGVYKGQSYMVMELLGRSLGEIFRKGKCNMSLTNLLLVLDQCLERIRDMHGMGMVHGDIKPDNMMMGRGEGGEGTLYFIDFGLVSSFWDFEKGKHLEFRDHVWQAGTLHFMSVQVHERIQKTRRDDLETLVYVLAYFLRHKKLPWRNFMEGVGGLQIGQMKKDTREDFLFHGYPKEFAAFFNEVRCLGYEDEPEYEGYRRAFRRLGNLIGIKYETDKPCFK